MLGVIIPACGEGTSISRTLSSIGQAASKSTHQRVPIRVVVNTPPDASENMRHLSQETLDYVRKVNEGVSPNVSKSIPQYVQSLGQEFPTAWLSEHAATEQVIQFVKDGVISIHLSDLTSVGSQEMNVGIARNIGVESLLDIYGERLEKVIMLDSDSNLPPGYIEEICKSMDTPVLFGGHVDLCPLPFKKAKEKILLHRYIQEMIEYFQRVIQGKTIEGLQPPVRNGFNMSGCAYSAFPEGSSMVFTPEAYRSVGGFPKVSGGEDTVFGQRLFRKGIQPIFNQGLTVACIDRFSERTSTGDGLANTLGVSTLVLPIGYQGNTFESKIWDTFQKKPVLHFIRKYDKVEFFKNKLVGKVPLLQKLSYQEWSKLFDLLNLLKKEHYDDFESFELLHYFLLNSSLRIKVDEAIAEIDNHKDLLKGFGILDLWNEFKKLSRESSSL